MSNLLHVYSIAKSFRLTMHGYNSGITECILMKFGSTDVLCVVTTHVPVLVKE
jgi:hypothetical protein